MFMEKYAEVSSEPHSQKSSCSYCGDAAVSHTLFYIISLISVNIDNHVLRVASRAPKFLRAFVDWLMMSTFETFLFFRLARLSSDINQARTFRSKVIWEEANKRGIEMKQLILFGAPLDQYRARINGKLVYFDSLPIPPKFLNMKHNWDDKFLLKEEFSKKNIPVPAYFAFPAFYPQDIPKIFSKLEKPIIVKPRAGSRGRHTITNINSIEEFQGAINIAKQISAYLVAEEHIKGDVCRATFVKGELVGFYKGSVPYVIGDGRKTVRELILEKDEKRPSRVDKVFINEEMKEHIRRSGVSIDNVLPEGIRLPLTHRTGRLFGGVTREMLDELHPSFVPILNEAAKIVDLAVIGFDCIVPDPTKAAESQKWGIIECNTLPFIDLHYYALEGKPKNIAGKIWDLWN
jgi:D-alanine-D-alanine ligase-like ATP-grasp enzyme